MEYALSGSLTSSLCGISSFHRPVAPQTLSDVMLEVKS